MIFTKRRLFADAQAEIKELGEEETKGASRAREKMSIGLEDCLIVMWSDYLWEACISSRLESHRINLVTDCDVKATKEELHWRVTWRDVTDTCVGCHASATLKWEPSEHLHQNPKEKSTVLLSTLLQSPFQLLLFLFFFFLCLCGKREAISSIIPVALCGLGWVRFNWVSIMCMEMVLE